MRNFHFTNGDPMPRIGLGTWLSKPHEVFEAVIHAIKIGYRHIDCAYIYKNEKEIGDALDFAFSSGLVKREELFITSKLWNSDHDPERVDIAIRKSLHDLRLDYLDLYLMHWPIAFKHGHEHANSPKEQVSLEELPFETTWKAMEKLKTRGLTRHIGVSNFNIPKLKKLIATSEIKPEVNQVELHPYFQQNDMLELCQENRILLTAYAPLGSRHLINTDDDIQNELVIKELAKKHQCTETQIILAWGLARGTIVIPKSVHLERIKNNFGALDIQLKPSEVESINALDKNMRTSKALYAVLPGGYYTSEVIWEK